jgi:hypothetical protein
MLLVVKQQSMQLVLPVLGDNMVGVHKQIITHFPLAHGQKSLHNPIIFTFSLWVTILPHVLLSVVSTNCAVALLHSCDHAS